MPHGNISAVLSQQDVDDIKAAIKLIESKMPFLIALDVAEKTALFKQGPKSVDFVNDAMNATVNFPELLPPALDRVEFLKDGNLYKVLSDINQPLAALAQKVEDTYTAVGSEAMGAALQVYAYVQTAAPNVPGVKPLADKLQERFKKSKLGKATSQAA
ncbi:MAG: hypothetical protein ABIX01_05280 [Chitinophagaceae bacterium]